MELFPVLRPSPGAADPSSRRWLALATAHQDTDPALRAAVTAWKLTHAPADHGADEPDRHAAARLATREVRRLVVHAAPETAAPVAEADLLAAREGRGELAASLWIMAIVRNRTANMHAAEPLLAEANALAQAEGDRRLSLAAMMEESITWSMLGQCVRAADNLRIALDLAREVGDRATEATLLLRLGGLHGQRSEPEPHALYSRAALHIFRSLGDTRQTSEALYNLGWALARQGRHAEAEDCYEQGLPIALDLGWKQGEALFLVLHAVLLFEAGRIHIAIEVYDRGIALLRARGEHFEAARHALLVGRHLVDAERFADAHDRLRGAMERAEDLGFRALVTEGQELLSRALEGLGEPGDALRTLRAHVSGRAADVEGHILGRVRAAERRVAAVAAQREAARERERSSELLVANTELRAALQREHQLRQVVDLLANTDPLTGLANRRHMLEFLSKELERARRQWQPLALVLLDLDHFKSVNDCHGHGVGDEVLVRLATVLKDSTRTIDLVGRWGGEEFCLALVNTQGEPAFCMTDRVRGAVQAHPFETSGGPLAITVSLGIADLRPDETSLDDLFRRADCALYEAKRYGRNRVAGGPEHTAAARIEA